ncbi:MAG: DUF2252 family protein [Candidatus Competibacteraceae bacterium]|jgi:uncharacterized protein (DUF2252 family)|nr:DUF2252 family protein [Candidatus Competibacteraceae bacterium]
MNIEDRAAELDKRRRKKMAWSTHAYVRGSTDSFYTWLESQDRVHAPKGPPFWICGDCHLGNLGTLADADEEVAIQIRDLGQTVIGNPAHDLIRLGLSLASAARSSNLPGVTTALIIEELASGYAAAFRRILADEPAVKAPKFIRKHSKRAVKRRWKHLAKDRFDGTKPTIPFGKRFWPLTDNETAEINAVLQTDKVRHRVCRLQGRDDDEIEFREAVYWVKGCSSLGRLRYAVLVVVDDEPCLLDLKEAAPPVAPRALKALLPKNNAERIVTGARELSPNLGERMAAIRLGKRPVVMRELAPKDLKLEFKRLKEREAIEIAAYLASVVGYAHAGQMDNRMRVRWLGDLEAEDRNKIDAPSWLWDSVVQLMEYHEGAYLKYCRRNILPNVRSADTIL